MDTVLRTNRMARVTQKEQLRMITEAVSRAKQGDFSATVPSRGAHDPLDELAQSVNDLLASTHLCLSGYTTAEEDMARLTAILENTSDLVSTATPDGRLTYLNRSGRTLVGWDESEDISGKAIADLHPAWAYTRIMQEGIPVTLATGAWSGETALLHRDGHEIPVSQVIMSHRGPDSQLRYLSTIMRDISEIRQATEELRRSEALYRNVVENANELIVVVQDGVIKYCNPKTYELSGYSHDELLSKPFLEFVHPDDQASIIDRYVRRMAGERLDDTYSFRLHSKNRGMRWFEVRARLIEWEGRPAILDSMTDITEHKAAEEALRESADRYRLLAENANDIIFTMDLNLRFTYISPSVERIRGYTVEEAMAQSPGEALTPASLETAMKAFAEELELERHEPKDLQRTRILELEERCKDGSFIWTETTFTPLRDSHDNAIGFMGITRDITERKKTEEALRQSEERYRTIFENTSTANILIAEDTTILLANTNSEKIFGYSRAEMEGKMSWTAFVSKDDLPMMTAYHKQRRVDPDSVPEGYEFRGISRDGSTRDIFVNIAMIPETTVSVASLIDITERKEAENALKKSEQGYRELYDNLRDGSAAVDAAGSIIQCNQRFLDMLGYTFAEVKALTYKDITPARWHAMEADILTEQVLKRGYSDLYAKEYIHKDKRIFPVELQTYLVKDTAGNPTGFWAFVRDITERKRAEEELRIFMESVQNSSDAVCMSTPEGKHFYQNKMFDELFGSVGENPPETVYVDPAVGHEVFRTIMAGGSWTGEVKMYAKDRSILTILLRAYASKDKSGRITALVGVHTDITKRKQDEDRLVSLTQRLNDIIEFIPDATFVIDQDRRVIAWNRALEEMTGVKKETMLGKGHYEYAFPFFGDRRPILIDLLDIPNDEIEAFYKYVHRQGDKIFAESYIPTLRDGRGAHLWGVAAPLFDKDGNRFGSIEVIKDVTENVLKEEERLKSEKKYREILEEIDDGYYEVDLKGTFTFFNNAMCRILGYEPDEMMGMNNRSFMDKYNMVKVFSTFSQVYRTGQAAKAFDWELIRKDGTRCTVETSVSLMRDDSGNAIGFRGISRDVTVQKNLQQQLFQAQKMESIGRMTGGIAHDFNNMLTPILGYSELLMNQLPPDDPRRSNMENIIHSAERSRDLVRQLLAFSRQQALEMKPMDLNSVITSFEKILRRTLHENVAIRTTLMPSLGTVLADVGQIEQILMNLAVNAQDAMPEGGTLFIETSRVHLDETYASLHKGSVVGDYVLLALSDTGTGMDQPVLEHLFEPFFTTKAPGKGTGLGLSTVYGIVKQHGGYIMVYSEPGAGTTFRIYFPLSGSPTLQVTAQPDRVEGISGTETVLVIEDEDLVRDLVTGIMRESGYTVLQAADARSAYDLVTSHAGEIHLVISDMILPDATGTELYGRLSGIRTGLKVLYMSGYTPDVISRVGQLGPDAHFIQKPFSLHEFSHKVRMVLDG